MSIPGSSHAGLRLRMQLEAPPPPQLVTEPAVAQSMVWAAHLPQSNMMGRSESFAISLYWVSASFSAGIAECALFDTRANGTRYEEAIRLDNGVLLANHEGGLDVPYKLKK